MWLDYVLEREGQSPQGGGADRLTGSVAQRRAQRCRLLYMIRRR